MTDNEKSTDRLAIESWINVMEQRVSDKWAKNVLFDGVSCCALGWYALSQGVPFEDLDGLHTLFRVKSIIKEDLLIPQVLRNYEDTIVNLNDDAFVIEEEDFVENNRIIIEFVKNQILSKC